ncbi:protein SUPPRESSOR OF npr1-1, CONSTITUTIVE 1-like [Pistacia vera]|uniref:protein SUPPRESSOR OF npr1-1, CONSTITUTIVE 1-like n=1 Tax=Pistacia vera TaxID=55513 RepID=UPI0012631299|nr:protein SUPPRESSOR OF npr1-1, CONSTITUTIVE 1-like [Pistacia vera]
MIYFKKWVEKLLEMILVKKFDCGITRISSKHLKKDKEIEAVRSISLDMSKISNARLDFRALSKMRKLRFLRVYNSQHGEDNAQRIFSLCNHGNELKVFQHLQSFPNGLTFFSLSGYPFKSVPKHFLPKTLVRLDMPFNKVKHWNGVEELENLIDVDLSFSQHMKELPNLSKATNLQSLNLSYCKSLLKITPSSIQNLNKLVNLDLYGCSRLISLPDGIQSERIDLSYCNDLKMAPKISCKVEVLLLRETSIKESPFIEQPSRLVELDLSECSLKVILDCKKTKQQIVLPIFHKVDHLCKASEREFWEGIAELQDRFKEQPEMLQGWKSALNEAANQSGWT